MQDALGQACPELSPEDVRRRFKLAMATIMTVVRSHDFSPDEAESKVLVDELVAFVAGGFCSQINSEVS